MPVSTHKYISGMQIFIQECSWGKTMCFMQSDWEKRDDNCSDFKQAIPKGFSFRLFKTELKWFSIFSTFLNNK